MKLEDKQMEEKLVKLHEWLKDVVSIPIGAFGFIGFWVFLLGWFAAYEGVPHVLLLALALLGLALALMGLAYLPMFPIWFIRMLRRKQEPQRFVDGESRWQKKANSLIAMRAASQRSRYDPRRGHRQTGRALARRQGRSGWR